jgi:hypothetical protein
MKKDGTQGELECHNCSQCGKQYDGKARGIWFERRDINYRWVWSCTPCNQARGIDINLL